MGHSWYQGDDTYTSPYFTTDPDYTDYNVDDRYTWGSPVVRSGARKYSESPPLMASAAHQRPAHGPLLRPLHRLRRACDRSRDRQVLRDRHQPLGGEVRWLISH